MERVNRKPNPLHLWLAWYLRGQWNKLITLITLNAASHQLAVFLTSRHCIHACILAVILPNSVQ